jgi:beta-lactamase regulating signal transducer with metallopeptidase domain
VTGLIAMNWQTIANLSVGRMLNWVMVGIAIALFAELLLRLTKRRNSGTRFAVWFSALLGIALVPLAGYVIPQPDLGVGTAHSKVVLPETWALYLLAAWATLTLIGLIRVGLGLWQVRQLRRASIETPLASLPQLLRTRLQGPGRRRVLLYLSETVRVPVAVGFLPAAIILPSWTLNELSPAELDSVLLHELAHIDRWDDWTNLVQRIIGAIFFFQPAVWWVENRLALEREMACDDVVLKETSNARDYAHCLVSLAEKSFLRRGLGLAQAAVTRVRQTSRRISQILDVNRPDATTIWKPALALVASFSLASLFIVSRTPQLVAFETNSAPKTETAQIRLSNPQGIPVTSHHNNSQPVQFEMASTAKSSKPMIVTATATLESQKQAAAHVARFVPKSSLSVPVRLATARPKDTQFETANSDAYLVVVQGHYAPSGEIYWSVGVVQLTIFHPNSSRTQQDSPPKSI